MRLDAFLRRLIRKLKYLFLYQGHLIDRSRELRLQNRFSEAEHILADILEKQPKNKSALSEYAQSASDQYNHLEAGLRWEKAIQGEKPNQYLTPNTFLKAAEAYLAAGWVEKARGGFLSLSPDFAEAALGIANCSLAKPQEWLTWVNPI